MSAKVLFAMVPCTGRDVRGNGKNKGAVPLQDASISIDASGKPIVGNRVGRSGHRI